MVNDGIDLGDHRRLGKPAVDADIAWNIGVAVLVVADVDQCPHGHLAEKRYQPLEKIYIAGAERAETHIQQRLAVVALEPRHLIGLLLSHAAFEILELLGRQRLAPFEFHGRGI